MFWEFFRRFLFRSRSGSLIHRMSWLSIVGIAFTVSLLVLVSSVMNALNDNVRDRNLALEPHWLVTGAENPDYEKEFKARGYRFSRIEFQDVIFRTSEARFKGAEGRGLSSESLQDLNRGLEVLHRKSQGPQTFEPVSFEVQEIWLGADLADALGVISGDEISAMSPESLLGSSSEVPQLDRVRVRGRLRTGVSEIDGAGFFYDAKRSFRRLRNPSAIKQRYQVWVQDADRADSLKEEFIKKFPLAQVQTWRERHSAIFFALKLEKIMISVFLSLAVLIASLSFLSVLSLLVSERQKEMGILQTLGFSRKKVRVLFFQIGMTLAALGLVSGLLAGAGLSYWIELHPITGVLPPIYYDTSIPARLDGWATSGFAVLALVISAAGAWWMSRQVLEKPLVALIRQR